MSWIVPRTDRRLSPNRYQGVDQALEGVVYHYTAGESMEGVLSWLCSSDSKVSAHFVVGVDGRIVQLMPLTDRAWHAGGVKSGHGTKFQGSGRVNWRTLGIELVNRGPYLVHHTGPSVEARHVLQRCEHTRWHPYPERQIEGLERLVARLLELEPQLRDPSRHVGHSDVDPTRKLDPGPAFPWDRIHRLVRGSK